MSVLNRIAKTTLKLSALGSVVSSSLIPYSSAHAQERRESAALTWVSPSTSYLPNYKGPLTRKNGAGVPSDVAPLLNPDVVRSSTATVAKRFDILRKNVLGKSGPIEQLIHDYMYNEKLSLLKGAWQGYCDRWSNWTGGDPQLVQTMDNTKDLACGGTYLSQAEAKELVTAFYSNKVSDELIGIRYEHKLHPAVNMVRADIGTDSLRASEFDLNLFAQLRKNEGIVANLSTPGQIWNFPIYRAEAKMRPIQIQELESLPPLPPAAFHVNPKSDQAATLTNLLAAYKLAHRALDTYTQVMTGQEGSMEFNEETGKEEFYPVYPPDQVAETLNRRKQLTEQLKGMISDSSVMGPYSIPRMQYQTLNGDAVYGLINIRKRLYSNIAKLLEMNHITLDRDHNFELKETTIYYAKETGFADTKVRTSYDTRVYEYVIITNKQTKELVSAIWKTAPEKRPGFMWVPDNLANPNRPDDPYADVVVFNEKYPGLSELLRIIKSCTNVEHVKTFFRNLDTAAKSASLTPAQKQSLRNQYRSLKSVINDAEVRKTLAGSSVLTYESLQ